MPKRKHLQLSIKQKLEITEKLEKGVKPAVISAEYGIAKQTISDIKRAKDKLLKYAVESESEKETTVYKKAGLDRTRVQYGRQEKLEEAIMKWHRQQVGVGVAVRGVDIKNAALRLSSQMGVPNFAASDGWLYRFRSRYGLKDTHLCGEAASAPVENVAPFREKLLKIIESEGLIYSQIYNFDETGLVWRALPTHTQASKDMGEVRGRKLDKSRISALLGANADGSHRLKPVIVGKAAKPRALKDIMHALPVHYYSSHNAWFTAGIFSDVFHKHIVKEIVDHQCHVLKIDEDRVKALVLLDNAPAHPSASKLVALDGRIRVMYLPPNTTSLIQPMDQGVIHAWKLLYRRYFLDKVLVVEDLEEDTRGQRTLQALKNYTIRSAIHNFADAWKALKMSTLANAWKKLLFGADVPVVDFTGFETHDFINRFQKAGDEVSEENLEDWLGVDETVGSSEILTDAEIVDSVLHKNTVVDDDVEEEHPQPKKISLATARFYCDELLQFISEREEHLPKQGYEQLRILRRAIINLQHDTQKQTKIETFFRPKTPTPPTTPLRRDMPSTSSAYVDCLSDSDLE